MAEPEPIGKGCECVYRFEKTIVLEALRADQVNMERVMKDAETYKDRAPDLADGVLHYGRMALENIRTVISRFEAMKECD